MSVEAIIDDSSLDTHEVGEPIGKCGGQVVSEGEFGKVVLVKPSNKLCGRCPFEDVCTPKSNLH